MPKQRYERTIDIPYTTQSVVKAGGYSVSGGTFTSDHGALTGLGDDDHSIYLLASAAGDRIAFAVNWVDLVDGGETALHIHDGRYYVKAVIDAHTGATAAHGATGAVVGTTNTQTLTNKTLTTPTISDFTNAVHAHTNAASGGQIAHTSLTAIGLNTHAQIDTHIADGDIHVAHSAVDMIAGDGLTGGGTIAATRTFTVGVANTGAVGLTVEANAVRLTSNNNPGATASVLASDGSGKLTLPLFAATTNLSTPLIISAAGVELSIASGADVLLNPGGLVRLSTGKLIRSNTFTSGFAGSGWQIDDGVLTAGKISAEFDNLTVRGRMSIYELLVRQIRATNGSVFVSSTGKAKTVSGGPSSFTITTDTPDNHGFLVGDLIRAQRFAGSGVYQCDLEVTGVTDIYTFVATKIAGDSPAVGMEFVRLGSVSDASRRGSIYLTADDSGAPFIDVVDGITSHAAWNSRTANAGVKVRVGRITGITGNANEYGIWGGTGTGDTAQSFAASSNGVSLNNVSLSFKAGSSTVVMQLSPGAGNASPSIALGSTLPTGPLVNDGIWLGKNGSAYEWRVGTVSGGALVKGIHWNGANLVWKATNTELDTSGNLIATSATLSGTVTANLGVVGNWTIASSGLTATNIGLYSGAANTARIQVGTGSFIAGVNSANADTDIAFWAGDTHANRASAEFRVTAGGSLYATTGTIAGDFTVTGDGKLSASDNGIVLTASGINVGLYPNIATGATPPNEAKALAWYDTPSTSTGLQARQYVATIAGTTPHWNVTVAPNATVPVTMSLWAEGSTSNGLWFSGLSKVTGMPGIFLASGTPNTVQILSGARLQLNSGSTFVATTNLETGVNEAYDLGTSGVRWKKLYVKEIVADTISGSSISGSSISGGTWRNDAGDMYIYSSSAGNRTLTIENDGAGVMNVSIDGGLTLGGNITLSTVGATVDGVDLSGFKTAYDSHNHDSIYYTKTQLQTSGSAVVHWDNITGEPATYAPSSHGLDDAVHTGTLSWAKVSKTGSNLTDLVTRAHSSLTGIGANDHHAQSHVLATTLGLGDDHSVSGLTAGQYLRATGLTTAAFQIIPDADLPSTIVRTSRQIISGVGLTGGGDLSADRTLAVGAGAGITVNADDVALTTPGTLTVATTNSSTGSHTHAITTSSNPGAAASILASDANGYLRLLRLGVNRAPALYDLEVQGGMLIDRDGADSFLIFSRSTAPIAQLRGTATGLNFGVGGGSGSIMFIDTVNSRVGINTASPSYNLDVTGDIRATGDLFVDGSLLTISGTRAAHSVLQLRSTTNDSGWSDGDQLGAVEFYSSDSSNLGAGVKASIRAVQTSASTTGGFAGLIFSTTNTTGSNDTERMRITHTGLVSTSGDISTEGFGHFKGWNVASATGAAVDVGVNGGVGTIIAYDRTGSVYIPLQIKVNSGNQIYLPIDGNIGLFTSAMEPWSASYRALQLGALGSIMTAPVFSASYGLHLNYNTYYDGAWKYQNANPALYFKMGSSGYTWTAAPTGVADATATLSSMMTLDLNGNLTVTGDVTVNGGMVDFGTSYFEESTDFELRGTKSFSLFQTIKAASWNITTTGVATFTDVVSPSIRAGTSTELVIGAGADIQLNPTGVVKLANNKLIRSASFTSGWAGNGWKIEQATTTSAEFDDLTIRGTMRVYELLIQQIRATNGSIYVTSSAKLASATFVSGTTYRCVVDADTNDYQPFAVGDVIRAQRVNLQAAAVAAGSGTIVWRSDLTVTAINTGSAPTERTFDATLRAGSTVPAAGMEFVRLGNTSTVARQGTIYLTADDSGAPFIDVVNGITAHTDWNTAGKVKARFGKLDGLGRGNTDEYGLWAGSGIANTERSIVASNFGVELNNVALKFKAGSSTVVMQLDPGAGNAVPTFAMGATLPTGPLVGDGLWMGKDGSDYELRVGTVSGGVLTKGLHWNGTSLNIVGNTIIGPGSGFVTTALAHWKFDAPSNNPYRINLNTHLGQAPITLAGSYRGDVGRFGGGLQLAPANVNYVSNPSFEVNVTDYWTTYNLGVNTPTRDSAGVAGDYCYGAVTGSQASPYMYNGGSGLTLATGDTWVFSAYVRAGNAAAVGQTVYIILRENENASYRTTATYTLTRTWQRISVTRTLTHAAPTTLNHYIQWLSVGGSGEKIQIDALKLEKNYLTGYTDGSMDGVTWASTAHNSASTQSAASYLTYSNKILPPDPNNGTLMMWVKPEAKTAGTYQHYFRYDGTSGYIIIRTIESTAYWQVYWGATGQSSSAGTVTYGQWHHIAVTRAAGTTKLYINGAYIGGTGGTEMVYHSTGVPVLGQSSDTANGVLDEVTLLDRALTADEILQVYQSSTPLVVPTTNNELSVSSGGLSVIRINSNGLSALNNTGDESFVLANETLNWGTRYTSGSAGQLTSGDMVLGNPDEFHLMYDASAASVLLGKATEEHILFSSSGIEFKNSSSVWAKIDANSFVFGKSTDQNISVGTGGLFFLNGATILGGISTLGVLTLGEYANSKSRMEANAGEIKFINRVSSVDTEYVKLTTAGVLTLGSTATEHMTLSGTALEFKNSTTVLGSFNGTTLTLGQTGGTNNNIIITPTSLEIRYGSTPKISLDSSGNASFTGAVTASSGSITGNLSIGSAGTLYSGAAATWQSAGYQLQYNAGTTPRMYIGDGGVTTGDKYFMWDGTNISFRGTNTSLTTGGLFTANDVDITGTINADSGSITGTLTMGPSGKIDTTYVDIDNSGITIANASADMSAYIIFGSASQGFMNRRTWGDAYETVQLMSLSATKSRVAMTVLNTGQPNGYNGIISIEQNNLVSKALIEGTTVAINGVTTITGNSVVTGTLNVTGAITENGNQVWHTGNDGTGSGLAADLLDGQHATAFANASHTHAFGDISGNGNISTTGTISVGSGTDSTNVISRMMVAGSSGSAVLMNNTLTTLASQYALSQSSTGDTFINAATAKSLYFRINNSSVMTVNATEVAILQPAAFSSWIRMTEIATAPGTSDFSSNTQGGWFIKGDRIYVGFNNGGTMRYYYLSLTFDTTVDAVVSWRYGGTSV